MLETVKSILSPIASIALIISLMILALKFLFFVTNIIPTSIIVLIALISVLFIKIVLKGEEE